MSLISKKSIAFFIKTSALLLAILFFQTGCVKKQETQQVKKQVVQKAKQAGQGKLLSEDLEKKAAELAQLRKETEALLGSLKEKEQNLNMRESHLDSLQADLQGREQALIQKTQNFKNMRSATLIMLFAVLVLLAIAIVLLLKAKQSGIKKVGDTEPEQGIANEEQPAQNDERVDLKRAPKKEPPAVAKAEEKAMDEKASALIAEIIDGEKEDQKQAKEDKTQEVKPKRKRTSKSTTGAAKKTTTTRRRTPSKPKPESGAQKEENE